jgi:LysR family glycine cleavage system transcriptional activator
MRNLPPLAAVRVFEAAARLGNFTRAGAELGMTQAAVSYQIRLIEDRLGLALFRRAGRGVALTDTGRRIAPLVTGAFDGLADAFALARSESEAVLTISCSTTFASNWLAVRLGGFQLARTGLAVRLHSSDRVADLDHGEADVAIRSAAAPWPGMVSHFLMRMPFAPLASPGFLAAHPLGAPADLLRHPRMSPGDRWWGEWLAAEGVAVERTPAGGVRLDSQVMEGNAALAGQGLAMLNPTLWRAQLEAGLLVAPFARVRFDPVSYWLVYPGHRRNAAKVRAFRDWLLAEMAREAEGDRWGAFSPPVGD